MSVSPFLNFTKLQPETGTLNGYDWVIENGSVSTVAYVKIPKGHPLYHEEEWRSVFDERVVGLEVNGGCSYWAYEDDSSDPRHGCCIGWDYGHYWNNNRELSREEVLEDIKCAIKFLDASSKAERVP